MEAIAVIKLCGVRKLLGGRPVLDGVDLHVQAGECVVLTGDSGAGKTTLLRLVAGLDRPEAGSIRLRGTDAAPLAPHERKLAFQFQEPALWPHMSLLANVGFGGAGAATRAMQFLERAGLGMMAQRKPPEVSGGEAQRAGLARSLAPRRDILLLDEPLSNLQPALRLAMTEWIREEIQFTRAACIWVAHDEAEADGVANRRLRLADGKLTCAAAKR